MKVPREFLTNFGRFWKVLVAFKSWDFWKILIFSWRWKLYFYFLVNTECILLLIFSELALMTVMFQSLDIYSESLINFKIWKCAVMVFVNLAHGKINYHIVKKDNTHDWNVSVVRYLWREIVSAVLNIFVSVFASLAQGKIISKEAFKSSWGWCFRYGLLSCKFLQIVSKHLFQVFESFCPWQG